MGDVFRQKIHRYIDAAGKRVTKNTPGARLVEEESSKWYGEYRDEHGNMKRVPLEKDKDASRHMLRDLEKEAAHARRGLANPKLEEHLRRPLRNHLEDFKTSLEAAGNTATHIQQTVAAVLRALDACEFVYIADLDASLVEDFLIRLRQQGRALPTLPEDKEWFTKKELAALLGVSKLAIPPMIRRHKLKTTGQGKDRRYARSTAEFLLTQRSAGKSARTSNYYLVAMKSFCNWLVEKK